VTPEPNPEGQQPNAFGEATRAVRGAPREPAQGSGRPLVEGVARSTAYAFDTAQEYADVLAGDRPGYVYARIDSPTAVAFAADLAALEAADPGSPVSPPVGQAFSSGMAAISTVLFALTATGDHVVAPAAIYGTTYGLLTTILARFGVTTTFVDLSDLDAVRAAITPRTTVLYAETIANPSLAVADIPGLAAIAREAGVPLVVDNTFASPAVCRPLALGADVVVHSATKYIGGHSDVVGGVAAGDPALLERIRTARITLGGSLAPDDAYLLRRGLQTLPLRVERQCATALRLATRLENHPALQRVDYPGLPSHRDHALAVSLFHPGRFGGMVTLTPHGGQDAGMAVCDRLRVVAVATSLGGTHSVVSHVATTTHRGMSDDALRAAGIGPSTIRISCGLEDPDDVYEDVAAALDAAL
jgi:cystathionine beta-lyase/cystathionine gamma-synthase